MQRGGGTGLFEINFKHFCWRKVGRKMKKQLLFSTMLIALFSICFLTCKNHPDTDHQKTSLPLHNKPVDASKLRKISFLPYWVTNAQFAGYYLGKELGFYEKYGIDLEIIPFQPFFTSTDMIGNKEADFAALWLLNAVEMRSSGVDIVNIAQFSSRSSLMLVAKKSRGIEEIEDMNGRKAGAWSGFELQPTTFFKKFHLNVTLISIGSTNNLFLNNGVEITTANWFDEYHSIINSGYNPEELTTFFFADYGLNFLEDGIYCLDSLRINDPELCKNFVLATAESWTYAFNNPERAIDIVITYAQKANQPVNRIHQQWMLNRYRDLYFSTGTTTTLLVKNDYMFAAKVLAESNLIAEIIPFEDFYKHYTQNLSK